MFFPVDLSPLLRYPRRFLFLNVKKTCRGCKNDERPTGKNTTTWMGRRCNLKIEVIPILILIKICLDKTQNKVKRGNYLSSSSLIEKGLKQRNALLSLMGLILFYNILLRRYRQESNETGYEWQMM